MAERKTISSAPGSETKRLMRYTSQNSSPSLICSERPLPSILLPHFLPSVSLPPQTLKTCTTHAKKEMVERESEWWSVDVAGPHAAVAAGRGSAEQESRGEQETKWYEEFFSHW